MLHPALRHERQPIREFPFVHVEAADGSSRGFGTLMSSPTTDIDPGTIMVVRADDGAVVTFDPADAVAEHHAPCIVLKRIGALPPGASDPRHFPINVPILERNAEVIGSRLTWPADLTADQRAALIAQLNAVGIAVL